MPEHVPEASRNTSFGDEVEAESAKPAPGRLNLPFGVYKRRQARISRGRLYPMTVFYSLYALGVFVFALRSIHPLAAAVFGAAGVVSWTLLEYLSHRYVLHGRFADGAGVVKHFLHKRLDPLHIKHHAHPWDGGHINGVLKDTLPLFAVFAPLSFVAPVCTLPVCYAAFLQSYVLEEWVHHAVHFYNFRNPYLRYIKRHHLYHHSPKGINRGYGISNPFWDVAFHTRFPAGLRKALHARTGPAA